MAFDHVGAQGMWTGLRFSHGKYCWSVSVSFLDNMPVLLFYDTSK